MQDLHDERANPKGESPVDFQAREPLSRWADNQINYKNSLKE